MAQHKSAKKRIVRNEKRRVINHARISRIRTFVKKVENAIAAGNKELAAEAFKLAQPELHRGVTPWSAAEKYCCTQVISSIERD